MHLQLGEGQPSSEFGLSEGDTMKTTNPTVTDLYESSTITLIFNIRPEALLSAVSCNIIRTVVVEIKFSDDCTICANQSGHLFGSRISCYATDGEVVCKSGQLAVRNQEPSTLRDTPIDHIVGELEGSPPRSAVHKVEGKPECFQLCTYKWRRQEILEVDVFYEETRIRMKEHIASLTHIGVSMRGVIYLDGDQLIHHVDMSLSKESSWCASSWCTGH